MFRFVAPFLQTKVWFLPLQESPKLSLLKAMKISARLLPVLLNWEEFLLVRHCPRQLQTVQTLGQKAYEASAVFRAQSDECPEKVTKLVVEEAWLL